MHELALLEEKANDITDKDLNMFLVDVYQLKVYGGSTGRNFNHYRL